MDANPFYNRGVISQPEHFYNRRTDVRMALERLQRLQNIEVTGPRRIGKTWFLHYIANPLVQQQHGLDAQRYLFVNINCQLDWTGQDETLVYTAMLECIAETARRVIDGFEFLPGNTSEATAFQRILEALSDRGLKIVLLMDEFENLAQNEQLAPRFFGHLRAMSEIPGIDVAYVTASRVPLVELCLGRESALTSPFFNTFHQIHLGLFDEQDSREMVQDIVRKANVCFPPDLLELVLQAGGGYPFFLQIAGEIAFELLLSEGWTERKRTVFASAFYEQTVAQFRAYWQKLDKQARYVLTALPLLENDFRCQEAVEHLRDQCLIAKRNGRYDYFSPAFEVFVRRQQVEGVLQAGPFVVDLRREEVLLRGQSLNLSRTNYRLLTRLMEREGQVVSNEELWQAGWAEEPYHTDEQLKSAIKNLRKALGSDSECVVNHSGSGYKFVYLEVHQDEQQ